MCYWDKADIVVIWAFWEVGLEMDYLYRLSDKVTNGHANVISFLNRRVAKWTKSCTILMRFAKSNWNWIFSNHSSKYTMLTINLLHANNLAVKILEPVHIYTLCSAQLSASHTLPHFVSNVSHNRQKNWYCVLHLGWGGGDNGQDMEEMSFCQILMALGSENNPSMAAWPLPVERSHGHI